MGRLIFIIVAIISAYGASRLFKKKKITEKDVESAKKKWKIIITIGGIIIPSFLFISSTSNTMDYLLLFLFIFVWIFIIWVFPKIVKIKIKV